MRAFLSSVKKVVVVHMRGRVRSLGRESVLRGMNEGPTASAAMWATPIHGADGEPIANESQRWPKDALCNALADSGQRRFDGVGVDRIDDRAPRVPDNSADIERRLSANDGRLETSSPPFRRCARRLYHPTLNSP